VPAPAEFALAVAVGFAVVGSNLDVALAVVAFALGAGLPAVGEQLLLEGLELLQSAAVPGLLFFVPVSLFVDSEELFVGFEALSPDFPAPSVQPKLYGVRPLLDAPSLRGVHQTAQQ